jgi:hypothetical protein
MQGALLNKSQFDDLLLELRSMDDKGVAQGFDRFEKLGRNLLFAGLWDEALECYEILTQRSSADFGWLIRKLRWRQQRREEFRIQYGAVVHQTRILDFFRARGWDVSQVDTKPARVGYVSAAAFVHTFSPSSRYAFSVHEKVFESTDQGKIDREAFLFKVLHPYTLRAPAFFGVQAVGDFLSVYYQHIEGHELPAAEWGENEVELIHHYWAIEPPMDIAVWNGSKRLLAQEILEKYAQLPVYRASCELAGEAQFHAIAKTIENNKSVIATTIRRMPTFVFHRDLHAGNTIRTKDGQVVVVDWEQWSLEPLGFGWLPYLGRGSRMRNPDITRIAKMRFLFAGFTTCHMLLMASLWGYYIANMKHRPELALGWLERLAEYSEQVAAL